MSDRDWPTEWVEALTAPILNHGSADDILSALADAGALLPPGAEFAYGVRHANGQVYPCADRQEAENVLAMRTVRRWVGPWEEVSSDE